MWDRERCGCLFCTIKRGEAWHVWRMKLLWMALLCLVIATGMGIVIVLSLAL